MAGIPRSRRGEYLGVRQKQLHGAEIQRRFQELYEDLTLNKDDSGFHEKTQTRPLSEVHFDTTVLREHETKAGNDSGFCVKTQRRQLPEVHSDLTVLKQHDRKAGSDSRKSKTQTRQLSEVHCDVTVSKEHESKVENDSGFHEKTQMRQLSDMCSDITDLKKHENKVRSVPYTVSTDEKLTFTKIVAKPLSQNFACSSSSDSFFSRSPNPEIDAVPWDQPAHKTMFSTNFEEVLTCEITSAQNVKQACTFGDSGLSDVWELSAEDSEVNLLSFQDEMFSPQNDSMSAENTHLCQACLTLYNEFVKKSNQENKKKSNDCWVLLKKRPCKTQPWRPKRDLTSTAEFLRKASFAILRATKQKEICRRAHIFKKRQLHLLQKKQDYQTTESILHKKKKQNLKQRKAEKYNRKKKNVSLLQKKTALACASSSENEVSQNNPPLQEQKTLHSIIHCEANEAEQSLHLQQTGETPVYEDNGSPEKNVPKKHLIAKSCLALDSNIVDKTLTMSEDEWCQNRSQGCALVPLSSSQLTLQQPKEKCNRNQMNCSSAIFSHLKAGSFRYMLAKLRSGYNTDSVVKEYEYSFSIK